MRRLFCCHKGKKNPRSPSAPGVYRITDLVDSRSVRQIGIWRVGAYNATCRGRPLAVPFVLVFQHLFGASRAPPPTESDNTTDCQIPVCRCVYYSKYVCCFQSCSLKKTGEWSEKENPETVAVSGFLKF